MTDNIVTRLRDSNGMTTCRSSDGFMSIIPDTELMREAADEIERLRAELKDADHDFHALKAMFDKMRAEVRGE